MKNWFETIKNIVIKFYLISPALYCFLNYFFVIKPEQRFTFMGWMWLIVSIVYLAICLYFLMETQPPVLILYQKVLKNYWMT